MCRSRRAFFFVLPDKYCFKFREFQNPETLALQWTETMEKPRAVALQRFSVVLGIFQNSSQIVVIPNESLKWEHKGDVTSVKLW